MAVKCKASSQDWFYHAPCEKNTPSEIIIPAASQIPGLSQIDEQMPNEDEKFTRKWIREDDSDYVKLAKVGGRKDLFRYREHKPSDTGSVPYPRSDWFDHEHTEESTQPKDEIKKFDSRTPEWFGHEVHVKSNDLNTQIRRPILGFDEKTVWQREEVKGKLPALKTKTTNRKCKSQGSYKDDVIKFPKINPRGGRKKSIDNGEMGDLLSFAYQKDFLMESKERTVEIKRKKQETQRERVDKLSRDQEKYTRQKKSQERNNNDKPLFKMKKFGNIQSRVDSQRI